MFFNHSLYNTFSSLFFDSKGVHSLLFSLTLLSSSKAMFLLMLADVGFLVEIQVSAVDGSLSKNIQ